MILPIGHDKGIYRQPWVTYGLIASCVLVHLASLASRPTSETLLELHARQRAEVRALWDEHGQRWVASERPQLRSWPEHKLHRVPDDYQAVRLAFMRDFAAGEVVERTHASYQRWQRFKDDEREKLGALRFAYRAGDASYTLITHAFLHGGWLHLIGNMLFLWLCGCNLEDRWGRRIWLSLYLSGAVVAALGYGYWHGWNPARAAVGASGAVSAAMGAFLIALFDARIRMVYFLWLGVPRIYVGQFHVRAYFILPLWLLEQVAMLSFEGRLMPVAHSAHVGGFVFGMAFAVGLKLSGLDKKLAVLSKEEATVQLAPQAYLDGLEQRENGEDGAARASFERLLAEHPRHAAGAYELFQIAMRAGDVAAACAVTGQAVTNLDREGDGGLIRQLWLDLNRLVQQPPLDARTWLALARSFRESDPATSLACYEALAAQHPDGPLYAKALLESGRMHIELHDRSSARRVLEGLTLSHAGTAFADQALSLMREYGLDGLEATP